MVADLRTSRPDGIDPIDLVESDAVQTTDHLEHAGHHAGLRESAGFHLLLRDAVAVLAQLLAVVGDIPGGSVRRSRGARSQTCATPSVRARPAVSSARRDRAEMHHLIGRTRHLARQRTLRIVGESPSSNCACSWRNREDRSMFSLLSNLPACGPGRWRASDTPGRPRGATFRVIGR